MNINYTTLSGRLGADAELFVTQSGMAIGSFSLCYSEKQKDGTYSSEWFSVKLFGKTAEWNIPHLKKGSEVLVQGKLSLNKFQKKDGTTKETYEIIGNNVKVIAKLEKVNAPLPMTNNDLRQPQSSIQSSFTEEDMPF